VAVGSLGCCSGIGFVVDCFDCLKCQRSLPLVDNQLAWEEVRVVGFAEVVVVGPVGLVVVVAGAAERNWALSMQELPFGMVVVAGSVALVVVVAECR